VTQNAIVDRPRPWWNSVATGLGGKRPDHEHPVPPEPLDDEDPQQRGQHGTDVVARHHRGGCRTTAAPRGVLVDQRQRGRQHTAETQPGQEPQQAEEPRVRRESAREGQHRERDERPQHRLPTADVVRDRAHRQRADHHPQQADDGHQGGGVGRETPRLVGQLGGQYDPQYHEVESLEGHREPAQRRHPRSAHGDPPPSRPSHSPSRRRRRSSRSWGPPPTADEPAGGAGSSAPR
jgi:hypothetical protein